MLSGIDSLNNLTSDNEYEIEEKIRKYFEETDLPTDEIEKRIGFALDIERVFRDVFILMIASEMYGELESKADEFATTAYEGYIGAMENNGYPVDPTGMGYVEQYARSRCKEIVDTAILHKADAFYGTLEHTIAIGEDESMAVGNYQREQLAIAQGYTQKTWVTCSDDRVRESHRLVDGQTIGIFQPFHLKGGQMMFPLDSSLGVNKREIYGCRCICEYSGRKTENSINNNFIIPNKKLIPLNLQFFSSNQNALLEEFKEKLAKGELNTRLKWQKQCEHIEGTKERARRIEQDLNSPNRYTLSSTFAEGTTKEQIEALIEKYSGKGDDHTLIGGAFIEYVNIGLDEAKGLVYNIGQEEPVISRRIAIRYSVDGVHCYPVKELQR